MRQCIPIIGGTGSLGYGLALRWARAGWETAIGSRDPERAAEVADQIMSRVPGAKSIGFENCEAVRQGPVVFLTVPFAAQAGTVKSVGGAMSEGQLLVDCTVPLAVAVGGRPTHTLGVWQGSAAQQAQALVPSGVTVVSALHTVSAAALSGEETLDEDILVCGNKKADKARVAELVEQIEGLRAVNAGALETSRIVESLTPMLISINSRYKVHAGIRITGLGDGPNPLAGFYRTQAPTGPEFRTLAQRRRGPASSSPAQAAAQPHPVAPGFASGTIGHQQDGKSQT